MAAALTRQIELLAATPAQDVANGAFKTQRYAGLVEVDVEWLFAGTFCNGAKIVSTLPHVVRLETPRFICGVHAMTNVPP